MPRERARAPSPDPSPFRTLTRSARRSREMAGAEGEKAAAGGAPAEASVSPRQMRRAPRRLSGILGGDGGLMNCARRGSSYSGPGGPGGRGTSEAMETRLDQLDAKLEAFKEEVLLLLRDRANAVTRAQDLGEQEEHVRRKAKENLTDVDEVTRMMSDPDFDRVLQQVMKNNALHRTSADLRPRSLDSQRRASSATQRVAGGPVDGTAPPPPVFSARRRAGMCCPTTGGSGRTGTS